jgi:hypothetical protein
MSTFSRESGGTRDTAAAGRLCRVRGERYNGAGLPASQRLGIATSRELALALLAMTGFPRWRCGRALSIRVQE